MERSRLFHCYTDIPGVGRGRDIPFERYDGIRLHDKGGQGRSFDGLVKNGRVITTSGYPLFYKNPLGGDYQKYIAGTAVNAGEKLDVSDPDQALLASNKLFCDNAPETPSLYWWQGMVYSRIPGEKDRHIFNVTGMNIRQCAKFEDPVKGIGYRSLSREIMLHLDPETDEILRTWDNPWTGETVEVMHVNNDPVNSRAPRNFLTAIRWPATTRTGKAASTTPANS